MTRRDEWRKCVEMHAIEGMGTTCDACLYLPEVYARMEQLEAALSEALDGWWAADFLVDQEFSIPSDEPCEYEARIEELRRLLPQSRPNLDHAGRHEPDVAG